MLVVQDHVCLSPLFVVGNDPVHDQVLCVKLRVRIALQTTGRPGQVDQQPVDCFRVVRAARRQARILDFADKGQVPPDGVRQVAGMVGDIVFEEFRLIAGWLPFVPRSAHIVPDRLAFVRERHFDPDLINSVLPGRFDGTQIFYCPSLPGAHDGPIFDQFQ